MLIKRILLFKQQNLVLKEIEILVFNLPAATFDQSIVIAEMPIEMNSDLDHSGYFVWLELGRRSSSVKEVCKNIFRKESPVSRISILS